MARKTSIDCYYSKVSKIRAKLYKKILETIKKYGADGITRGEIAEICKMEKSTVSARVNELLKFGILYEDGTRKDKYTDITAHILKINSEQENLFY